MLNYDDYIAVFNSGDDAALLERFFAEDVVFTGGSRDYQGKPALRYETARLHAFLKLHGRRGPDWATFLAAGGWAAGGTGDAAAR